MNDPVKLHFGRGPADLVTVYAGGKSDRHTLPASTRLRPKRFGATFSRVPDDVWVASLRVGDADQLAMKGYPRVGVPLRSLLVMPLTLPDLMPGDLASIALVSTGKVDFEGCFWLECEEIGS